MARSAHLQAFLDASEAALLAATIGPAALAARRAVHLWKAATSHSLPPEPARLPVCAHVAPALSIASKGPRAALANAFSMLEPQLRWQRRSSARPADGAFWHGHGNAMILGPGGLEERNDLWVGATVMAPGVTYLDHDHPPEEVYLSLTPGEWWNAGMDWTDPGPEGSVYNPPGILHRMRSGPQPFLALWYLPA